MGSYLADIQILFYNLASPDRLLRQITKACYQILDLQKIRVTAMFLVILAALVSVKPSVDACSPSGPSHPFSLTL